MTATMGDRCLQAVLLVYWACMLCAAAAVSDVVVLCGSWASGGLSVLWLLWRWDQRRHRAAVLPRAGQQGEG